MIFKVRVVNMALFGRSFFSTFIRYSGNRTGYGTIHLRPCPVQAFSVTTHGKAKSQRSSDANDDEDLPKPIKFSTSKGSHRTWKVDRSMGSSHQRPWWKVLPVTLFCTGFLLWCIFRHETEVDKALDKTLYEHLPGLLTDMMEEAEDSGTLEKPQKTD